MSQLKYSIQDRLRKFSAFAEVHKTAVLFSGSLFSGSMIFASAFIAFLGLQDRSRSARESAETTLKAAQVQATAIESLSSMNGLTILQDIRTRFLDLNERLKEIDAVGYPANGLSYNESKRRIVRSYWDEIVFHEYMMCNEFQGGLMKKQWTDHYSPLIERSLKHPLFKQEYAIFRTNEPWKTESGLRFFAEIDRLAGHSETEWLLTLKEREADIQKSRAEQGGGGQPATRPESK